MIYEMAMPEELRRAEFADGDSIDFVQLSGLSVRVKVERIFVNPEERKAGEYPDLKIVRAQSGNLRAS